jgi:hypothetical protein
MKLFALSILFLAPAAFAAPGAPSTLLDCEGYKVQYTGAAPHFVPGNPLKNTDSKREGWAVVDGQYTNVNAIYFIDLKGKRYEVKTHREMAFQYNHYMIERDVFSVPGFNPDGEMGSPVEISIIHDPSGNSADMEGMLDYAPACKIFHLP